MTSDWIFGAFFFAGLLLLVFISEKIYKAAPDKNESIRKAVHVTTGAAIMLTPLLFHSKWPLLAISSVFFLLNFWAIRRKHLASYNFTKRASWGTAYYPLAFMILLLAFWDEQKNILFLSFAIMAFADPVAGTIGVTSPESGVLKLPWDRKSQRGAFAMFVASFIILLIGSRFFETEWAPAILASFTIAGIATAIELLSWKGSDNLTAPLFVAASLYFAYSPETQNSFFVGTFLAAIAASGGYFARFLDLSGALGAFLIGVFIFGAGGSTFTIPILLFFVLSSLLSKLKERLKGNDEIAEKGGRRDVKQVFANGLAPALIALSAPFLDFELSFLIFLGAVAAATADTWATEIGMIFSDKPRSILTLKPVPTGASGGVTFAGTMGAFLGASVIAFSGVVMYPQLDGFALAWVVFAGIAAQFLDSFLGATLQNKRRCTACGRMTERATHCGETTIHSSGWRWMDNDAVNMLCTAFGALVVMAAHFGAFV